MKITKRLGKKIINNFQKSDEHHGMYYFEDGDSFVAIDNTSGECFVEDFDTEIEARIFTESQFSYETIIDAYQRAKAKTYHHIIKLCELLEDGEYDDENLNLIIDRNNKEELINKTLELAEIHFKNNYQYMDGEMYIKIENDTDEFEFSNIETLVYNALYDAYVNPIYKKMSLLGCTRFTALFSSFYLNDEQQICITFDSDPIEEITINDSTESIINKLYKKSQVAI